MSLFPLTKLHRVRPVAAADYYLATPIRAWFSQNVIGIIPLDRTGGTDTDQLFETCRQALDRDEILILFPEGSRGEALFAPFNCDVVIGEPLTIKGKSSQFVKKLTETYDELFSHCLTRHTDKTN